MKVEILRRYRNELHDELEYDLFFTLFTQNQPLLSSVILRPMNKRQALDHYAELTELAAKFGPEKRAALLDRSAALPPLDALLNFFEKGQLEQYHLFELGNFLQNNTFVCSLEKDYPLDQKAEKAFAQVLQVLEEYTEKSFSAMRESPETEKLQRALGESAEALKRAAKDYENEIFKHTGLKMIYPWPRELALSDDQAARYSSCELLTLKKKHDVWLLDYNISQQLAELKARKKRLTGQYERLMQNQLKELNAELSPCCSCLKKYYRKRVKRTWHYVLLAVMGKKSFCLPEFSTERGCHLEKAYLYGLKVQKGEKCIPLDLTLGRGATLLYGANMSGKTTVLKTVYFLLTLVQLGLPLPARKIALHYPQRVMLSLKSHGDIRTSSSTFSEELSFFAQKIEDGAYIFSDELFLSTDPDNGVILSQIIIQSMAAADRVFFCTTHYPEILNTENSVLYKMEDADPLLLQKAGCDLQSLHNFMPYRLTPLTKADHEKIRNDRTPLRTALLFDLDREIKAAIKKHLEKTQSP